MRSHGFLSTWYKCTLAKTHSYPVISASGFPILHSPGNWLLQQSSCGSSSVLLTQFAEPGLYCPLLVNIYSRFCTEALNPSHFTSSSTAGFHKVPPDPWISRPHYLFPVCFYVLTWQADKCYLLSDCLGLRDPLSKRDHTHSWNDTLLELGVSLKFT